MSGINDVTARTYVNRWDLLRSIESKKNDDDFLIELLIEICEKLTRNRILAYKVQNLKKLLIPNELTDPTILKIKKIALIKGVLNALSADEYHLILTAYLEYQQNLTKKFADQGSDSDEQMSFKRQEARNLLLETLAITLEEVVEDIGELGDASGNTITGINESMHTHIIHNATHSTPDLITEVMTPTFSVLGFFQVGYDVSVHNTYVRNAFHEMQQTIKNLDKRTIASICKKYADDPDAQVKAIKEHARDQMCNKLFSKVLYTGALNSVFIGMILSFVPYAFVITFVGIALTTTLAFRERKSLHTKITEFINQNQLDLITVDAITSFSHDEIDTSKKPRNHGALANFIVRSTAALLRISALIYAAFSFILPFVGGVVAAVNAMFTWVPVRNYLKTLYKDPALALQGNLDTETERRSLTTYYGSNLILTYIFKGKGLDALQQELKFAGVPLQKENKFMYALRAILSPLGIMYSTQAHGVLKALYDGNNTASIHLLEKIRLESKHFHLEQKLDKYLRKNGSRLNINKSLEQLREEHMAGNSSDFYKLLHNYLDYKTVYTTKKAIFITGFTNGFSWALLTLGIGLTFFAPLAPLFAIAACVIIGVSFISTYLIAKQQGNNVRKALKKISDAQFIELMEATNLTHYKQFCATTKLDMKPKLKETVSKSVSKLLKLYPATASQTNNMQKDLLHICDNLNRTEIAEHFSNFEYAASENPDASVSVYEINKADNDAKMNLLTAPANVRDPFNLHNGTEHSWQIFLAFLVEQKVPECAFSLGNVNLETRAEQFVEAMLIEFINNETFDCDIRLIFEDVGTAQAIYKVLQEPELITNNSKYNKHTLDKLRAHFGLILINGDLHGLHDLNDNMLHPYIDNRQMQNQSIFSAHISKISRLQNIPLKQPYYITQRIANMQISDEQLASNNKNKRNVKSYWHSANDLLFPPPELVILDTNDLDCVAELKESILGCFKARKAAIEKMMLKAKRNADQEQINIIELAIEELEHDFKSFVKASRNHADENVYVVALQYCEKRTWLPSQTNFAKQFQPTEVEAAAIVKLRDTAQKLYKKNRA